MRIRTQVAIALIVPSIVVIAAGLNYSGMCVSKWSYLADTEALESALRHQARYMEELPENPSREQLQEYVAAHPGCCIVLGHITMPTDMFIDYVTGYRKNRVRILYKSKSTTIPRYRDAHVAVLPCGQAVDEGATLISEDQMKERLQEISRAKGSVHASRRALP